MPRDGAGTYNPPEAAVSTATPISSASYNASLADIASALTQSLSRDGQTVPSANMPMGTFRHTNVGNATARNEYATLGQVQDGAALYAGGAGGTANAITISFSPAITAYAAGQSFRFVANTTNTGAVTLSVNGLVAATVAKGDGLTALAAGDIPAGHLVTVQYDGVRFRLGGVQSALGATLAAAATPEAARTAIGATATGSALMTAADAPAARTAIGATVTGSALMTAADAPAARATLAAPATPTATTGVPGQWSQAGADLGAALTLPAGGTWAYLFFNYNNLNAFTGTVIAGAAAGGTVLDPGVANFYWTGLVWRVA